MLPDEGGDILIAGATFPPSKVLFELDRTQYDLARQEWEIEQTVDAGDQEVAA
jgi:hypothetical protein